MQFVGFSQNHDMTTLEALAAGEYVVGRKGSTAAAGPFACDNTQPWAAAGKPARCLAQRYYFVQGELSLSKRPVHHPGGFGFCALVALLRVLPVNMMHDRPGEPSVAAPPTRRVGPERKPGGRGSPRRYCSTKPPQVRAPATPAIPSRTLSSGALAAFVLSSPHATRQQGWEKLQEVGEARRARVQAKKHEREAAQAPHCAEKAKKARQARASRGAGLSSDDDGRCVSKSI